VHDPCLGYDGSAFDAEYAGIASVGDEQIKIIPVLFIYVLFACFYLSPENLQAEITLLLGIVFQDEMGRLGIACTLEASVFALFIKIPALSGLADSVVQSRIA